MRRYLVGETAEQRQRWRAEVLATTKEDFKSFGDRLARVVDGGNVVAFGSKGAFDTANEKLPAEKKIVTVDVL